MEVMAFESEKVLFVRRWKGTGQTAMVMHFGSAPVSLALPLPPGRWEKLVDSSEKRWGGTGASLPESLRSHGSVALALTPHSLVLFSKT